MIKLLLLRHGKTLGNVKKQYIGRTDESLFEEKKYELMEKKEKYMDWLGDDFICFTSPMKRCKESLRLLFPGCSMEEIPFLIETDFGVFEGKTYQDLIDVKAYQKWLDTGGKGEIPQGESFGMVKERAKQGMEEIMIKMKKAKSNHGVIMTHGGIIMHLCSLYVKEKQEFYTYQVDNGSGYLIEIEEKEGELEWSIISHLQ